MGSEWLSNVLRTLSSRISQVPVASSRSWLWLISRDGLFCGGRCGEPGWSQTCRSHGQSQIVSQCLVETGTAASLSRALLPQDQTLLCPVLVASFLRSLISESGSWFQWIAGFPLFLHSSRARIWTGIHAVTFHFCLCQTDYLNVEMRILFCRV